MIGIRAAALVTCLALCGCVTRGALVAPSLPLQARPTVELVDTPFYPQSRYQCGPAALATVLGASGVTVTPEELTPLVYVPARRGSLQLEMQAAPRRYARLAYQLRADFSAILAELDARRPVLVLHNYGLLSLPRWHYAVVIGYDSQADTVVLRSGTIRRQVLSARNFMRAWDNGGRWAMVTLRPGELPVDADPDRYLESAALFERIAQPRDSWLAFDAAVKRWSDEPVAWIGRGTASYRGGDLRSAVKDYTQALKLDPSNAGARNNLAQTLLDLGCPLAAQRELAKLDQRDLPPALRLAVEDTRRQIDAGLAGSREAAACP